MDFLVRDLIHMGLSEKEARIYVAALQLGPSPIQEIAEHAQVNRPTTYVLIESLSDRGLISTTVQENKRVFIAEAPDRLLLILQMQRQELENRERKLTELLPKLAAVFNNQWEKPEIRYLDGSIGLNVLRTDFEHLEGEIVQIIGYDAFASAVDFSATEEHRESMARQFVPTRAIFVTNKQEPFDLWGGFKYRVVSPEAFPFAVKGEITVRADHVYLFSYEKGTPLAVDVRSPVIADTHRALFELAWRKGTPARTTEVVQSGGDETKGT